MAQTKDGAMLASARRHGVSKDEIAERIISGQTWCYCCKTWLQRECFGEDKSRSNGLASACKRCVSIKGTACRYGISIDEARSLRSGDRVCEICGRKQKLEVDHDHTTGKVRGVLCSRCNGALGQFCDSTGLLKLAIAYLEAR